VRFSSKSLTLLIGVGVAAACEVPTTHLPATHQGIPDAGRTDAPTVSPDVRRDSSGDSSGDGGCQQSYIDLTVPDADIMLLVERSSAMNTLNDPACDSCGTYFTTLVEAVKTLTGAGSINFRWGLKLFPSLGDGDACLVSSAPEVPLAADASAAIASVLAATTLQGGAPTTMAVRQAVSYLASVQNGAPKFIVLATSSAPSCALGDPSQDDFSATVTEVSRSFRFVFVLGLGPEQVKFDRIAAAGSTVSTYSADRVPYLQKALQGLAMTLTNCNYPLPGPVLPGQMVSVLLDNTPLPSGAPNGFVLSPDGTQVILQGGACYYIGTHSSVTIKVGCDG